MEKLIWGIVKSDKPTLLKGAFLDKISTAATFGRITKKECKAIVDTCLEILYPDIDERDDEVNCWLKERVEGVLTKWVEHNLDGFPAKKRLKVGDVVVMKTLPPNSWRLGRVDTLVGPGKRSAKGATLVTRSNGTLVTRPLQEIIPLGIAVSENNERESKTSVLRPLPSSTNEEQCQNQSSSATSITSSSPPAPPTISVAEPTNRTEPTAEPVSVTPVQPNNQATTESTVEPSVETTSSAELIVIPSVESVEPSVEPTEEPTSRRRKRRGSAVTGEVKRRNTRRKNK